MITINNKHTIGWEEGITVKDVLKKMNYDYPLISVHINDEYVPKNQYEKKTIPDEASVAVIHLAHGG